MRTTDWDMLAASSPLNADAARAWVYGYDGEEPILLDRAAARLPTHEPGFQNLIGLAVGRLVVVACAGSKAGVARWIVRCVCGRYEIRRSKSPRLAQSRECERCHRVIRMREGGI